MPGNVRIGLSGWNYPDWKDGFYKGVPQRKWLRHAASVFDTLEVNATFYRSMKPSTYEKWRDETPPDFRFSIKGSRYVTHYGQLKDPRESVLRQRDDLEPLAGKIAAVLWQTPAKMEADTDRLKSFLEVLNEWDGTAHAIEFRNTGWFTDEIASILEEAKVANVVSDAADWPCWEAATSGLVYIRMHGHTRTYRSAYSEANLAEWAGRIREWTDEDRTVLCYFDNDAEGAAPDDARRLRDLIEKG
jgi:uncharacterized protein YecE (DUF72 family)